MVTVIIVTHNSQTVLPRCLASLADQTRRPERIILVDSGSTSRDYLQQYREKGGILVHHVANRGFGAANNSGVRLAGTGQRFLLFLNPDAYLLPTALETAIEVMEGQQKTALLGGRLLGYDHDAGTPTGRLDSTGVFRTWYGRWYDRGQGEPDDGRYGRQQQVPALCGAFLFCRREALAPLLPSVFDETFFLYKEDIDLCLRLTEAGWNHLYAPQVQVYHCRGWNPDRRSMTRAARLMAARSELHLTLKHRSPYLLWAVMKYLLVRFADS